MTTCCPCLSFRHDSKEQFGDDLHNVGVAVQQDPKQTPQVAATEQMPSAAGQLKMQAISEKTERPRYDAPPSPPIPFVVNNMLAMELSPPPMKDRMYTVSESPDSNYESPWPSSRTLPNSGIPTSRPSVPVMYKNVSDSGRSEAESPMSFNTAFCRERGNQTVLDAGSCSIAGTSKGKPKLNQDRAALCQTVIAKGVAGPAPVDVFAVFDGIGPQGHIAADAVNEELEKVLSHTIVPNSDVIKCFVDAFNVLDKCIDKPSDGLMDTSGTTATILLALDAHLIVGNVGDCRAVLGSIRDGSYTAIDLCEDHKPGIERERRRIRSQGGDVRSSPIKAGIAGGSTALRDKDAPASYRVVQIGATGDEEGLKVSRALGCWKSRGVGVIGTPEVYVRTLHPGDKFVILSSGSVWEQFSSLEAVSFASAYKEAGEASRALANEARRRAQEAYLRKHKASQAVARQKGEEEEENLEDMTAVVIFLAPMDIDVPLQPAAPVVHAVPTAGKKILTNGHKAAPSGKPPMMDLPSDTVSANFQVWFESQVQQLKNQKEMRELYQSVICDDVPSASASSEATTSAAPGPGAVLVPQRTPSDENDLYFL